MPRTQAGRMAAIKTALAEDALLLRSATIREELGRSFEIHAELLSEDPAVDFTKVVLKPAAIRVQLGNGKIRYFHGIVSEFSQGERVGDLCSYRATIVPHSWMLTRRANCRISQKMTRAAVVKELLKEYEVEIENGATEAYGECEYIVQYRETDHNFMCRLLEHEGITFFHKHLEKEHKLVLADNPGAFSAFEGYEKIRFATESTDRADEQRLTSIHAEMIVTPAAAEMTDFDPTVPNKDLRRQASNTQGGTSFGEVFDFPSECMQTSEAEKLAKIRLEELQASRWMIRGTGTSRGIAVGHTFEIENAPRTDLGNGKKWLVTSASHQFFVDDYLATGSSGSSSFTTSFTAIPSDVKFRTLRTTPRPMIAGPQTAIVCGTDGDELHVDKYGRVKVQFHWDRYGKRDQNSSCWMRVSQPWAGKAWGAMFLPRIGQEVIVEFLEGDPDRPIITGRVYNDENRTPMNLPDHATVSILRTNTSKGGGAFHEVRFEDKKGEEQMFVHASRHLDTRVVKDQKEWVGENRHIVVVKDRFEHVKHDEHLKVDNDTFIEVGKDLHLKATGKAAIEIGGSRSVKVTGADASEHGGDVAQKITGNLSIEAGKVTIKSNNGVTLICGGNSVVIDSAGVTIKGSIVTIDGSMTKINSGPGSPAIPGTPGTMVAPTAPKAAEESMESEAGQAETKPSTPTEPKQASKPKLEAVKFHTAASAAEEEAPKHWIAVLLVDEKGNPMAGEPFSVMLPDGSTAATGTLDEKGQARVDGIDAGNCEIRFPNREPDGWNA
jgi:type VI secretion system secreted protein VgrG